MADGDMRTWLTIGQMAERTGLSVHTLRFYEREGLLGSPVRRGPDGRRLYDEEDAGWLDFCTRLRATGMPLVEIRRYVDLLVAGPGNEKERLAILRAQQERVEAQIAELSDSLRRISFKVGVYEEHVARGTADRLWSALPRTSGGAEADGAPAGATTER